MVEHGSKLRVGVIFGGRSGEHEVSLLSARSVLQALDPDRYEVIQIGLTHDGAWVTGPEVLVALEADQPGDLVHAALLPDPTRPGLVALRSAPSGVTLETLAQLDVVFPVLHGTFGEDGTLQGLLELADLAYVGAGVTGSAVGMDKAIFKHVMRANGIPVVEAVTVLRSELEQDPQGVMERAERVAGYPLFIKPVNLGSSVGISKVTSRSDLLEGLLEAARFDRRILIERGVNGREIEVSVLGNDKPQASVPGEILPSREFYSYEAKYVDGANGARAGSGLLIPAPIAPETTRRVQELAVKAYQAIDCAGMARVDFLLDKDQDEAAGLYLNEVNTIPGFTQISMYPKLWEASGLPYPALLDRLIELALQRKGDRDRTERRYRKDG